MAPRRLESVHVSDVTSKPQCTCSTGAPKASIIVQIHASALRRPPQKKSLSWRCSSAVVRQERDCGLHKHAQEMADQLHDESLGGVHQGHHRHGEAPSAHQGHCLHDDDGTPSVHQGHGEHLQVEALTDVHQDRHLDGGALTGVCQSHHEKSEQVSAGHQAANNHVHGDSVHPVKSEHCTCVALRIVEDEPQHHQSSIDVQPPHRQSSFHRHHELEPGQQRFCANSSTQVETIAPQDSCCTDHDRKPPPGPHVLAAADSCHATTQETLSAEQAAASLCHQAPLNPSSSVPLDVLQLINRLKTVAKERMIEGAVAKLMSWRFDGAADEEPVASDVPAALVDPDGAEGTEERRQDEGCEAGPSLCHQGAGRGAEDTHEEDPELRRTLQNCGMFCKSLVAEQEREKGGGARRWITPSDRLYPAGDPYQAETDVDTSFAESPSLDSAADRGGPCHVLTTDQQSPGPCHVLTTDQQSPGPCHVLTTDQQPPSVAHTVAGWLSSTADSSKRVPPVVLKRQMCSLKNKFKVVMDLSMSLPDVVTENSATERHAEKKLTHGIGKKLKQNNCTPRQQQFVGISSLKVDNYSEWKRPREGESCTDIAVTGAQEKTPISESATASLWQNSRMADAPVMVQSTDNSSSSQRPAGEVPSAAAASHLSAGVVSETISTNVSPGVPEGHPEVCDSDEIVEQIDRLLSEINDPLRVRDCGLFRLHEPTQDADQAAPLPTDAGSLEDGTLTGTGDSCADWVRSGGSRVGLSDRVMVRQQRKKGPPYRSSKVKEAHHVSLPSERDSDGPKERSSAVAAGRCNGAESVDEDPEQSLIESFPSLPQVSPGSPASALRRFETLHPHLLKPCSVILLDLETTELELKLIWKTNFESESDEDEENTNTGFDCQSSKKLKAQKNKHATENKHDFRGFVKRSEIAIGEGDAGTICEDSASTTFPAVLPAMPTDSAPDAAVHIPLEGSQPFEQAKHCVFISSESETESKPGRAVSEQMCPATDLLCSDSKEKGKRVRSLQTHLVKEKSHSAQDKHAGSARSTSRQSRKASSGCAGKLAKGQPNLLSKQHGVETKRKTKPVFKPSASSLKKQVGVSQSHSWEDVVEIMNSLSGSSCAHKAPPEATRTSLPRIPKRSKPSSDNSRKAGSKGAERERYGAVGPEPSVLSGEHAGSGFGGARSSPSEQSASSAGCLRPHGPGQPEQTSASFGKASGSSGSDHARHFTYGGGNRSYWDYEKAAVDEVRENVFGIVRDITTSFSSNPCQAGRTEFSMNSHSFMPVGCRLPPVWPNIQLVHNSRPSSTIHESGNALPQEQTGGRKDSACGWSAAESQSAQNAPTLERAIRTVVETTQNQQSTNSAHIPDNSIGRSRNLPSSSGSSAGVALVKSTCDLPRDPRKRVLMKFREYSGTAQPDPPMSVQRCAQEEVTRGQVPSATTKPFDPTLSAEVKDAPSDPDLACMPEILTAVKKLHKCHNVSLQPQAVSQGQHHPPTALEANSSLENGALETVPDPEVTQELQYGPRTLLEVKDPREPYGSRLIDQTAKENSKSETLYDLTDSEILQRHELLRLLQEQAEVTQNASGTSQAEGPQTPAEVAQHAAGPSQDVEVAQLTAPEASQEAIKAHQEPSPEAMREWAEAEAVHESTGPSQKLTEGLTIQEGAETKALARSGGAAQCPAEAVTTRKADRVSQGPAESDATEDVVEDGATEIQRRTTRDGTDLWTTRELVNFEALQEATEAQASPKSANFGDSDCVEGMRPSESTARSPALDGLKETLDLEGKAPKEYIKVLLSGEAVLPTVPTCTAVLVPGVSAHTSADLPSASTHIADLPKDVSTHSTAVMPGASSHSAVSLTDYLSSHSSGHRASEKNCGSETLFMSEHEEEDGTFSTPFAEGYTVIDECGDPDAACNVSVGDVVIKHLDLETNLQNKFAPGKARKLKRYGTLVVKKDREAERKPGSFSEGTKMARKRPRIQPEIYCLFAKTVVKAHEDNRKIDVEQNKRLGMQRLKSPPHSSRNLSPSDPTLESRQALGGRSRDRKEDGAKQASQWSRGSRSPSDRQRRKSRSPSVLSRRARSRSPYVQRRSRSPNDRQRSRTPCDRRQLRSPFRRRSRSPAERLKKRSRSLSARGRARSISPHVSTYPQYPLQQRPRSPYERRRGRSRSPSVHLNSRAGSPPERRGFGREERGVKKRSRSPCARRRARSISPDVQQRPRSPYERRRGRSRSPSVHLNSRAGSPPERRGFGREERGVKKRSRSPCARRRARSISPDVQQRPRSPYERRRERSRSPSVHSNSRAEREERGVSKLQLYVTLPSEMSHIATFWVQPLSLNTFWVQPLSQRGCHISIWVFQLNQFLQSFLHQKHTLVTHIKRAT